MSMRQFRVTQREDGKKFRIEYLGRTWRSWKKTWRPLWIADICYGDLIYSEEIYVTESDACRSLKRLECAEREREITKHGRWHQIDCACEENT